MPIWERILLWLIVAIGVGGGVIATITAITALVQSSFHKSCFVNFFGNATKV